MLGVGKGSSKLGIGNVGVQTKFVAWNRKWRSSSPIPTLGIGNGGVRARFRLFESGMEEFDAWNREWRSSTSVRGLDSEIEEIEPGCDFWNWKWRILS